MCILRFDLFLKVRPHFSQATLAMDASLNCSPPAAVLLLPTLASEDPSAEEWTSRWWRANAALVSSDSPHDRHFTLSGVVASEAAPPLAEEPEVPANHLWDFTTVID